MFGEKLEGNFASRGKIAINTRKNVKSQSEFLRRVWTSKRAPKAVQKKPLGGFGMTLAQNVVPRGGIPPKKVLPQAAEFVSVT